MVEQLTREQRKGKKQKRMVRVLFKSKMEMVQRGKPGTKRAGQILRTTHTATAVRGNDGKYAGQAHKPMLEVRDLNLPGEVGAETPVENK